MVHLLLDTSPEVQKLAYPMLQNAAQKRTEYLVVEAGVELSENAKFELPSELLHVVQTTLEVKDEVEPVRYVRSFSNVTFLILLFVKNLFGYLLGWTLIYDLFDGAVRTLIVDLKH
jgi:hypothetical protein